MTRGQARLALVCAIVGLGASVGAAYVHYHLLFDPNYTSFCDVNATVSCTQVYQSRFSMFLGIPVAIFGAISFAVAVLLSVGGMAAAQNVRESIPGYLFVLSTLALSVILYLAYASFFVIKAVCLLCLITYAAVIGLFVISGAAVSFPMTTLPRRMTRDLRVLVGSPLALTLALLLVAGAGTTLAFFPRESVAAAAAPGQWSHPRRDPGSTIGIRPLVRGAAARPVDHRERRRESARREIQRLSVSGLWPVVPAVQADFCEV
jgi:uncharacterized membrane protein